MIKARIVAGNGRRDLILLGITPANVEKLEEGKPIHVAGPEVGLDVDIAIMHGDSEAAIAAELREAGLDVPQVRTPRPGERKRIV